MFKADVALMMNTVTFRYHKRFHVALMMVMSWWGCFDYMKNYIGT